MKLLQNENVTPFPGEEERIERALAALREDPHAAREISVRLRLHIHLEYPKQVGNYVAHNELEEKDILAAAEQAELAKQAELAGEPARDESVDYNQALAAAVAEENKALPVDASQQAAAVPAEATVSE